MYIYFTSVVHLVSHIFAWAPSPFTTTVPVTASPGAPGPIIYIPEHKLRKIPAIVGGTIGGIAALAIVIIIVLKVITSSRRIRRGEGLDGP